VRSELRGQALPAPSTKAIERELDAALTGERLSPGYWPVGDTTADLQTARHAGLRSILVRTGAAGRDGKYAVASDLTCDTLQEAVACVVRSPAPGPCEPAHRL